MSRQKVMSGKRTPRISSGSKLLLTKKVIPPMVINEANIDGSDLEEAELVGGSEEK
jgi:hypothetical protein